VTAKPQYQLTYQLRLDAPALLTTLAGDPNTVDGERHIPGSSLLGAFAGQWIRRRGLGGQAHEDETFARLFLRGGLTFFNAYPEDPDGNNWRLLPAPLSMRQPKGDRRQVLDEAGDKKEEADTRLHGYCAIHEKMIWTHDPATRLRLHTARADRLLGRPTATQGALFAYQALDGGQTFQGRLSGCRDDLTALAGGLDWARSSPLTLSVGRSRSAEYGGQARLRLIDDQPQPWTPEVDAPERQEPEDRLVLTLTSPLIPYPDTGSSGRLLFPFGELAAALNAAGLAVEAVELQLDCRTFAAPALIGGYSGVWGMPRPQVAALAAGSVFALALDGRRLEPEALQATEQQALGQRGVEGFGRFVLNWHGERGAYTVQKWEQRKQPAAPKSPPPDTFRHVTLEVARSWAREQVQAEARAAAREARPGKAPSPALLRRVADLLRTLDAANAPDLRARLTALRERARGQLEDCRFGDGQSLSERLDLLCSPDVPTRHDALRRLLHIQEPPLPLRQVLQEAAGSAALDQPEQLARLANLFIQVLCTELARPRPKSEERSV